MRSIGALIACFALCLPAADDQAQTLERGRSCVQRFDAGELQPLWDEFSADMRGALGTLETLAAFREQTRAQLGAEVAVVEETAEAQGAGHLYRRVARFEKFGGSIEVVFGFDADGKISTFYIRPAAAAEAATEFLDYRTKADLRLPFEGAWFVFWGGRTVAQNQHAATSDQRFACDIVILRDGSSHVGEGQSNEEYHCFGQPIVAPAAGVVVEAVGDLDDNVPGQSDRAHPAGNHVVLDHGHGEYSLLAHFRKGTLKVAKGDTLKAGALLAECGNSGNSSEPHLHFHLQNGPELFKAAGLPAQFQHYVADGEAVERGEPVKGQTIAPQPDASAAPAAPAPDAPR
jgi:hypothetical protein